MKHPVRFVGRLFVALVCAAVGRAGAQGLSIQSFDAAGKLSFSRVPTATVYRVEWAPTPAGPWTNFNGAAEQLDAIAQFATGSYTCSVPMVYRVVATVTNAPPVVPSGMVLIPAGSFSMGDSLDGDSSALPVHTVYVSAFYMDKYEVTKAKWDEVAAWAAANGYDINAAGASGKAADHPAQYVTWYECVKWCNARSQKEGRTPCYTVGGLTYKSGSSAPDCNWTANGFRLPTEAEWEKAARGGLTGKRFPWGDTITHSLANYYSYVSYAYDTSPTRGYHPTYNDGTMPYTSPGDAFAANGYGLYDMAGNLWEWCWDWYGSSYYSGSSPSDPRGPSAGAGRVGRGGSWNSGAWDCRAAGRRSVGPSSGVDNLGFRSVLPPGQ